MTTAPPPVGLTHAVPVSAGRILCAFPLATLSTGRACASRECAHAFTRATRSNGCCVRDLAAHDGGDGATTALCVGCRS